MPSLAALLRALPCLLLLATSALAQSPLSHLDDAAPVPSGALRLRIANVWTRYDERFGPNGKAVPLGDPLSADSLGSAQLPLLAPIEASLRAAAVDPTLRLSLGQLRVGSNARIATTPIALEYGVTRRLSVGVLIPIVQTRRVAMATVTGDKAHANLGYVSAANQKTAAERNAAVAAAYRKAADSLGALLTNCPGNPGASGCAAVNANPAAAATARTRALVFADAATQLGTTAGTAVVAPRATSALADTLEVRRAQLNQLLQQYLGVTVGFAPPVFFAPTDFSYIDLNGRTGVPALLGSALAGGLDSIHTTERIGFGDIAVGAQLLVFDRFQHDAAPPPRVQSRLAVGASVRFATSLRDSAQSLVDISTGDGAGFDIHSAWDVIVGHFGATTAVRYSKSFARTVTAPLFGDPEAPYPFPAFGNRSRTAGDVIGLDLTPRLLLTDWLALDGHYGFERVGATTYGAPELSGTPCANCRTVATTPEVVTVVGTARTAQRVGVGLRYSTVDSYARGQARYPVEISYAHLATAAGDEGLPHQSRDQIQMRLYYQIRRPR
ncbi:MAG TPA: hypothetical protein VFI52_18095 [Gemmatimonadaceae bacterium]|nr:hypothetical protein [Gemmatimonadaceae bacterium]